MSDLATWSAAASAVAAAVAAFFSWRSNVQARAEAREQQLPHLHAQLVDVSSRRLIEIVNDGPGIAKGVGFLMLNLGEICQAVVPPPAGFLRAGQGTTVEMHFTLPRPKTPPKPPKNYGVFFCRDLYERPHYWTLQGEHRMFTRFSWRRLRRVPQYPGVEAAMKLLYSDDRPISGLDIDKLRHVGITGEPRLDLPEPLFTSGDPPD